MKIVISYAREDRHIATELVQTLTGFGHQPWTDAGAHSGGRWWDEILAQIRGCDLLLIVMSPALLSSKACTAERQYALALNRLVLPVVVVPMAMQGLPSDLVQIHMLDYTQRDAASAVRLFQAIGRLPPAPPLPSRLPPAPAPPLSYLNDIADRLHRLPGDLNLQHEIVTGLTNGLSSDDPEERSTAAELVRVYLNHPQRLQQPAERAELALGQAGHRGPGPPSPGRPPAPPPARARAVTVLAWIGGVAVALVVAVVVLVNLGGSTTRTDTVAGAVVAGNLRNELALAGVITEGASCGDLQVAVGATAACQVVSGGLSYPYTVQVTTVQGGQVTSFNWYQG